jgi:trans-2,3-dihydro-3-hydroxyanthranilate isomerase
LGLIIDTLSQALNKGRTERKRLYTKFYIVDAFTRQAFDGAQIAVFPEADGLNEWQMQILARELNLSDSIFIKRLKNEDCDYQFKTYAPVKEKDFGGHAIIAAAYVLGKHSYIELREEHTSIKVLQNSGLTNVVITKKPDNDLFIQFNRITQSVIDRYVPEPINLAAALNLDSQDIGSHRYNSLLVSCDQPYLIVPLKSFAAVRRASFDYQRWSSFVAPISFANEILLFSTASDRKESNFHGRLVGPKIGVNEDPPIGAAIPAFTGYLSAHSHSRPGTYSFIIDRGVQELRKSILSVELVNRSGLENEIRVGGPAVLVAEASINIPNRP